MQPYDWRSYLESRVYDISAKPPLEGITEGGYRLVYTDRPTQWWESGEKNAKVTDLTYSGGLVIDTEGNAGWAYGGDPMDASQAITLGSANLNSGAQAFAALDIRDSADRGDTVSALVTVP